ncbi:MULTISPECIES: SAM-dependent methyltransferase TehB [Providencia]|uniref:SAM-dependent methyltransferase TehB n=1 Tax=Providencia TaxID=586 RepID=UPI001C5A7EBF|nr:MULTISPECIES: SAM-dependent methyltransferase TehB [Providencia]ELR5150216.1 SAM-dependent methyltransferase TehB [Providencia rettgeri]QXX83240.1 SAM-dependent methyltransferase TehB [Providencia sp. R33]
MQLIGDDMNELVCYKTMPVWDKASLPVMFQERHNTKEDSYAQLKVLQGSLDFIIFNDDGSEQHFTFDINNQPPIIEPQVWHRISDCSDDLQCQLSFMCKPELKFFKEYGLTTPHSEVRYLCENNLSKPCKTLDLGSGRGRNSFYLALQGYDVTSVDINPQHIQAIDFVKKQAGIENINTAVYDINSHQIQGDYDLIISTVVLMFLQREKITDVVKNMQEHTLSGGINVIVCAVETPDAPMDLVPFNCFLRPGELEGYYQDWEILKYNENPGHLHRTDAQGNRIKLNFATLIAKKK